MEKFKRYTITAALPYANGPLHLGHMAGVYLPADIYVRYLRSKKREVVFICGSDEHGVPITIKARKEGVTPQEVVDKYHSLIEKTFGDFGITFDIYSRTSLPIHHETAREFFTDIFNKNGFIEKTTQQFFDVKAQLFLADRYITGKCPKCGYDKAYGDQCESCGVSLNPTDLIKPISTLSNKPPVLKETSHWFLPLDKFQSRLEQWILEEHKEWKSNVYGQCKSWLNQGLEPRAVTRDLDWGVKVPLENAKGKVLYVWFEAPIGYISATKEWAKLRAEKTKTSSVTLPENNHNELSEVKSDNVVSVQTPDDWKKYWLDKDTRLIHFIGKDNIVFHCIIFPAILMAHGDYIFPDNVPANEFLNLEGEKLSTSRNWAVWLHEYLEDFPGKADVLRYVLCINAPENKDNDFTWKDFQARNNNELCAILGNFVNRVFVLTYKFFNGLVPEKGAPDNSDKKIISEIALFPEKIADSIENFKFRDALMLVMDLARAGNKYLAETEPWKVYKENPARAGTILYYALQVCANLAILTEPFMPVISDKILGLVNIPLPAWESAGKIDLLNAGLKINPPVLLFEKIEDDVIHALVERLKVGK